MRPEVLILLALKGLKRHRVRSAVTILVVALAVIAVVATSGRTDATRRTVLEQLENPAARLVRIILRSAEPPLGPVVIDRISQTNAVDWVIGLGPAGPLGRNHGAGDMRRGFATKAVGTRLYWGQFFDGPLARLVTGRTATRGEAIVGADARRTLGLADGIGVIDDERMGLVPVVGTVALQAAIQNLDSYALIAADEHAGPLSEIWILANSSGDVEPLLERIPAILGIGGQDVSVDRAAEFVTLRNFLTKEVGELDQAVLLGSLTVSVVLIASIVYGSVEERRREFGLRRAHGASRGVIAALILTETMLIALLGSLAGGVAGVAIVAAEVTVMPDVTLAIAIACLVICSAVLGAVVPAYFAAIRQPLYVLRSE